MASVRSSESLVVTAGVLATGGDPSLPLVIAAAALGAFTGARVLFGRTPDRRPAQPAVAPGSRKRAALERVSRVLANRGGSIIGVRRYIRGGAHCGDA
jgi:membrane protein DedA with SNARE-associated domain